MSTVVKARTTEQFFKDALDIARKIDRGEKIEARPRVLSYEPEEFARMLTPERLRVLQTIRKARITTINDLAEEMHKNRDWVSRTVKVFEREGLIRSEMKKNPGHGQHKVVSMANDELVLQTVI